MVKVARLDRGVSQSELAMKIKRSNGFVKEMEQDWFGAPSKLVVERICNVLGLNFSVMWEVAWRERMFRVMRNEGIDPWSVVTFKENLTEDQKAWIRKNPDILERQPYSSMVQWNGKEVVKRLNLEGFPWKRDRSGKSPVILGFPGR